MVKMNEREREKRNEVKEYLECEEGNSKFTCFEAQNDIMKLQETISSHVSSLGLVIHNPSLVSLNLYRSSI